MIHPIIALRIKADEEMKEIKRIVSNYVYNYELPEPDLATDMIISAIVHQSTITILSRMDVTEKLKYTRFTEVSFVTTKTIISFIKTLGTSREDKCITINDLRNLKNLLQYLEYPLKQQHIGLII